MSDETAHQVLFTTWGSSISFEVHRCLELWLTSQLQIQRKLPRPKRFITILAKYALKTSAHLWCNYLARLLGQPKKLVRMEIGVNFDLAVKAAEGRKQVNDLCQNRKIGVVNCDQMSLIPNRVTRAPSAMCGRFVTSVQVFDLAHLYDATIPAQRRAT